MQKTVYVRKYTVAECTIAIVHISQVRHLKIPRCGLRNKFVILLLFFNDLFVSVFVLNEGKSFSRNLQTANIFDGLLVKIGK